jgi:phosphonoacetaldehyde hydrolase
MHWQYTRRYCGPVRAVILDWAGTSVDHGCMGAVGVFVEVFKEQGLAITPGQARGPMGFNKREHLRRLTAVPELAAAWRASRKADPTEADIDALYTRAVTLQKERIADFAEPIPGVPEVVAALRERGIRIGSISGYDRELLEILARAAAVQGYAPDVAVAASDVPQGRPAPFMHFEAAKLLGAWPIQACVVVGDTPLDIEAGLNAGMWTVGVALTGNELGLTAEEVSGVDLSELAALRRDASARLWGAGAHFVIDSAAELLPVIARIQERLARGERP